jgi:2-iminoacetate synthase ThiH
MSNNTCKLCQYRRDPNPLYVPVGYWCSNSQSPRRMTQVADTDGCDQFTMRGRKAPLKMRLANKTLTKVNKTLASLGKKK